jgi:hypothetical protein
MLIQSGITRRLCPRTPQDGGRGLGDRDGAKSSFGNNPLNETQNGEPGAGMRKAGSLVLGGGNKGRPA